MVKYLVTSRYSSASWARLVRTSEDRTAALRSLIESLGGSVELLYWGAHGTASYAVVDLPDARSAKAAVTAGFKTGGFISVDAEELLTQDELRDTFELTRSAEAFFEAPGKAAIDRDVLGSTLGPVPPWRVCFLFTAKPLNEVAGRLGG